MILRTNVNTRNAFDVYAVYFRRDGIKRQIIVNDRDEAVNTKNKIVGKWKHKFLGMRPLKLVEVR